MGELEVWRAAVDHERDALAARLKAQEQEMVICRRCFDNAAGERDALEAQAEHEWKARQLADDAQSASIGALEDESRVLELRVLNQGLQLSDRLGALEQRLADNEVNLSDVWRTIHIARKERDALAQRLAELERGGQLVVPGEVGEWVHRDGCLMYDLDVTESHK